MSTAYNDMAPFLRSIFAERFHVDPERITVRVSSRDAEEPGREVVRIELAFDGQTPPVEWAEFLEAVGKASGTIVGQGEGP